MITPKIVADEIDLKAHLSGELYAYFCGAIERHGLLMAFECFRDSVWLERDKLEGQITSVPFWESSLSPLERSERIREMLNRLGTLISVCDALDRILNEIFPRQDDPARNG